MDTCQAAFRQVLNTEQPAVIDSHVIGIGLWRIWLYPAKDGAVRAIGTARPWPAAMQRLTDREIEVCRSLYETGNSKVVANKLGVALSTIYNHRSAISGKLGIDSGRLLAWCGEHAEWWAKCVPP